MTPLPRSERKVLTFDGSGFEVIADHGETVEIQLYSGRRKVHEPLVMTKAEILRAIESEAEGTEAVATEGRKPSLSSSSEE